MMGTQGRAVAEPIRVLVTNEGNHTPEVWARETARALVAIDPDMVCERREAAIALRGKIYRGLLEHFSQVRPGSLASELETIGRSAVVTVQNAAKGSPWEAEFAQPDIRLAMANTIMRNIDTSADLAVRTE